MRVKTTYDYGDMVVEWDGWTGQLSLFSKEGERLGRHPGAFTQEEIEDILRKELGYVSDKKTIRPAVLNMFPFP
jgi:hypothetical protein